MSSTLLWVLAATSISSTYIIRHIIHVYAISVSEMTFNNRQGSEGLGLNPIFTRSVFSIIFQFTRSLLCAIQRFLQSQPHTLNPSVASAIDDDDGDLQVELTPPSTYPVHHEDAVVF
jgi:hypothetical protein